MSFRLIVGLGNPGPRYAKTRHNVGFRLVEHAAGEAAAWKDFQDLGRYARKGDVFFAEPLTFMNESGRFVRSLAQFYKVPPADILVCFDDIALPLGRLRLKPEGSSGGQKGMQSILDCFSTQTIARLRLGIGPQPVGRDSAGYVLEKFSAEEEKALPEVLERASQALETACSEGLEAAMNRFNPKA